MKIVLAVFGHGILLFGWHESAMHEHQKEEERLQQQSIQRSKEQTSIMVTLAKAGVCFEKDYRNEILNLVRDK